MRKSHIWLIVVSAVTLALGIGITLAYLVSSSNTVKNVFTVGEVNITLTETTGSEYKIVPGASVTKNPTVTVSDGSEACWLFVNIEKSGSFDTFCTYEIGDGWTILAGHNGIYYRKLERALGDMSFEVLKNNRILINDTITEELLNTINVNPTLTFTAYAAQSDGLETAHDAWQILNQ